MAYPPLKQTALQQPPSQQPPSQQEGIALFVVLVLLVVLTMLSLSAMRSVITETRISGNYQHKNVTFQTAENLQESLMALPIEEVVRPAQSTSATPSNPVVISSKAVGGLTLDGKLALSYMGKGTNVLVSGNEAKNGIIYQSDAFGYIDSQGSAKPFEGNPTTQTRATVLFPTLKQ